MAEGRRWLEWGQTSSIIAYIVATDGLRDPKKRLKIDPADFNPTIRKSEAKPSLKISIRALKETFSKQS